MDGMDVHIMSVSEQLKKVVVGYAFVEIRVFSISKGTAVFVKVHLLSS